METTDSLKLSSTSKDLFKSSATWMRTYAILLLIGVVLLAIGVMILSADREGKLLKEIAKSSKSTEIAFLGEIMGVILIGGAVFLAILGYAASRLLSAGNSFTAISYAAKKNDLTKAIKSLKLYWMYYGISLIVVFVLLLYIIVKMIFFVQQNAG